jgi:Fic family protein
MAGQFRRESVSVGDRVDGQETIHHQPPPWPAVEGDVEELLEWIQQGKEKGKPGECPDSWIHAAIIAGIAQHRLVWIHPFVDGNGRTARMFTTLILYQRRYDFKYLFNLSHYYNDDRDKYYGALRTADQTGDYTEWLEYFLGGFSHQLRQIEECAKKNVVEASEGAGGA